MRCGGVTTRFVGADRGSTSPELCEYVVKSVRPTPSKDLPSSFTSNDIAIIHHAHAVPSIIQCEAISCQNLVISHANTHSLSHSFDVREAET